MERMRKLFRLIGQQPVVQLGENPYMQYMLGLSEFTDMPVFDSRNTREYQEKMAKNVGERNEIKATSGTGKRIYWANNIRAKLPDTGE